MAKRIKAETINAHRSKWFLTHSIQSAKNYAKKAGGRTIYQLPNGVYALRKSKKC